MSTPAKLAYLVNTYQARDFREAGAILSALRPRRQKPLPVAARLPYKDD
jgi:hypothetical protein